MRLGPGEGIKKDFTMSLGSEQNVLGWSPDPELDDFCSSDSVDSFSIF